MTPPLPDIHCDLLIIGAGMAGTATALFAARQGLDTVQVGMTGGIDFASGLIDLMGVHPIAAGQNRPDPWEAIAQLSRDCPRHPYARIGVPTIRAAMVEFLGALSDAGLPYHWHPHRNLQVITALGTLKTTYAVPESMAVVETVLKDRPPGLLVDFQGLKGFSARQITATLADRWPTLQTQRLPFPGLSGDLQPERMARRLETPQGRDALVRILRPHLGGAQVVGLPAVLGISRSHQVFRALQASLGVPVFEIPTMLPAVAGQRLRDGFERELRPKGIRVFNQWKVFPVPAVSRDGIATLVGRQAPEMRVRARAAVLASGRFFGRGLHADRGGIRETIFDLPVFQPSHRSLWHRKHLFDAAGHPIHRAGLAVDDHQRPCDARGNLVSPHLFAAGSILAHQDWMRQKCGSGLAIASAYAAVRAARVLLETP